MINKQEAYWLLEKLAAENDYLVVHLRELRRVMDRAIRAGGQA